MSRRPRGSAAGISLFPFLAVLICTMGSLIVLLVLFVQQAKVYAESLIASERAATQVEATDGAARLRTQREEHEWRQQVLEQQRAEKTQELSDALDHLGHLDDHIRRLKSRAEELMKLAQDIDLGKQLKDDEREAAKKELERLRAEIARKKKEAEETKKKLANAQRWFALIPYDGPNGTRRRPIYVECTEVGIVLQPEGIALLPSDFNGPLGAGNPLDAALRMKREYLQRAGETATPYPLLVVRPDGIIAYSVARAAMKAWDDEFGYELIDGEKKLAYGDPDPGLVSLMQTTVRSARQKQAALAAAMPRKFQSDEQLSSFHPEEAMSEVNGNAPPSGRDRGFGGSGQGRGFGGGDGGNGGTGGSGTNGGGATPGTGNSGRGGGFGQPGAGAGGSGGGNSTGQGTGKGGSAVGGNSAAGKAGQNGAAGGASNQPGGGSGNQEGGGAAGGQQGGGTGNQQGAAGGASGQGGSTQGGAPGGSQYGTSTSGPSFGSPSSASGASGGSDGSDGGDPSAQASSTMNLSASKRVNRRGQNWGLPDARKHATAITRPIRVVLEPQRVVIMPERGDDRLPKEIRFKGPEMTAQEADQLVVAVQKHMQLWGLAVEGGYWKPLLKLEVAPNAEARHQQIETALQGSGFEIQQKTR